MPHNMRWLGWGRECLWLALWWVVVYDAVSRLAVVVAEEWE
jgi:hypothetical protein